MANRRRDLAKERWWREALKRQAVSGLSVCGFCRREKLAESAFYAWRRIVAERDAEIKPTRQASAFVPMAVIEPAPRKASIEIELAGGRLLRLPVSIAPAQLAELVHALEGRASR
jgi:transposase-like protein